MPLGNYFCMEKIGRNSALLQKGTKIDVDQVYYVFCDLHFALFSARPHDSRNLRSGGHQPTDLHMKTQNEKCKTQNKLDRHPK